MLPCHISDHYLLYATLKLKILKPPPRFVQMRSFKHYYGQQFVEDLERISWDEVALVDDGSDMLDNFNNKFIDVLDMHAPVKTIKRSNTAAAFLLTLKFKT